MSGTIIRGTLIKGLNRPQKRKTQLSNRAHSANHLVRLYSHTEPRLIAFLRSEEEEGLLDGDPGEEEATNDDNSIVTLHPDTMEFLQLSYSTRILPKFPKRPNTYLAHDPAPWYGPSEAPSNPWNDLRLTRGLPAEASSGALHLHLARG